MLNREIQELCLAVIRETDNKKLLVLIEKLNNALAAPAFPSHKEPPKSATDPAKTQGE